MAVALRQARLRVFGLVVLALLAWLITRMTALGWSLNFQMDEIYYQEFAESISQGSFPVDNPLYSYPQGAGLLFWSMNVLPGSFHRVLTAMFVGADSLIMAALLWRVIRRNESWRGPLTWIIGGYLAGGLMYERFDVIPTAIAVFALLSITRPGTSGFLAGLGAAVKVWPLFVLFALPRKHLVRGGILAVLGYGVLALTATLLAANSTSFLQNQFDRGLQIESSGAAPLMVASILGLHPVTSEDRFGASEIVSPYAGAIATISILIGALLIGLLLFLRISGKLEDLPGADVAFAALLIFVTFNKVYSPQFFIWLTGVAAVTLLCRKTLMLIPIVLVGLSMIPSKEYIGPKYWSLQAIQPIAVTFQAMRIALLILAVGIALFVILRHFWRGATSPAMLPLKPES